MRLNVIALGITTALLWGGAIFLVACANLIWPSYGGAFLDFTSSIYPGYHAGLGSSSVITGTFYGLVDGGVGGMVFGWLYNLLVRRWPNVST